MPRDRHKKPVATENTFEDVAEKIKGRVPETIINHEHDGSETTFNRRTLQIRTTPITIGIPQDELMFSKFFSNFVNLSIMPWDGFIVTASTLVEQARNIINDTYLEKSHSPYLFMLDSDVLPPPNIIERLLADDKPVVGGFYRKKEKFPVKQLDGTMTTVQRPVVYDYSHYDEEKDRHLYNQRVDTKQGLEKVDGMGAGCWMIKREVIEAIGKSPFSLSQSGEDLCFCRAVYEAGYEVWVDWDLPCAHCGVFWV